MRGTLTAPVLGENLELFNLKSDPMKTDNLASSQTERVQLMRQELAPWSESVINRLTGGDYERALLIRLDFICRSSKSK